MQPTFLIGVNSFKFANCWQTNCGIQNLTRASPYDGLALSNACFMKLVVVASLIIIIIICRSIIQLKLGGEAKQSAQKLKSLT